MINFDMYYSTLIDLTAYRTAEVNVTTASLSVNVGLHTPISYCGALFELPVKKVGIKVDVLWKGTKNDWNQSSSSPGSQLTRFYKDKEIVVK